MNADDSRTTALSGEVLSPLPEVRWRVAAVLADVTGAEADALVLRLVGDPDHRVRQKAISVVTRRFSSRVAQACAEELGRARSGHARSAHAAALVQAGAPGRPILLEALSNESASVRLTAARALPGLFVDAPTVAALEAATRLETDDNVRAALLSALGRTGRREAVAPLLLELDGTSVWLRVHALVALGEIGDPEVSARLLPFLDDPDLRAAALVALSNLDNPAPGEELARRAAAAPPDGFLLAALRRAAASSPPETVNRLARLWPGAREALLGVLERAEAPPQDRTSAAHLLARLDLTGAAAALVRLGPFEDEFDALQAVPAERFREALFSARECHDPEPALALVDRARTAADRDAVAGLLTHSSPLVVCATLGTLLAGAVPVATLVGLLGREDEPGLARAAAFSLAREADEPNAERARACLNALLDRASGPDGPGRAAALSALGRVPDTRAGAVLRRGLAAESAETRRAAASAAGFRSDIGVEDLRPLLRDEDAGARAAALRALTRWAEREPETSTFERKELLPHLADEPIVAAAAGAAVVAFAGADRPRLAIEMLAQKGPVRRAAVEEIAVLGDRAAADAVAFALPHEDPDTARAVVKAMALASPEVAAETLGQALLDARPEIRKAAAEAVVDRGTSPSFEGPVADALAAALATEAVPAVVSALLGAVAVAGGASSILPLTRVLATDGGAEAADRAVEALARRHPDRVREAWASVSPRAARRLSRALTAGRPRAVGPGEALPESTFVLLADLVRRRTGRVVRPGLRLRAARALSAEAAEAGSFARLYGILRESPTDSPLFGRLLDVVAGRTSSFFEDPAGLEALTGEVAPERLLALEGGQTFAVWCAGCGTGEEVYGLAILLLEKGVLPAHRVRIHATDLSPDAIRRAKARVYGARSLRAVSEERRQRFFEPIDGGLFRVHDEVAACVSFAARPLFDEPRGSGLFDAVLCRNLLPALEESVRPRAVETLAAFLKPGGYLLLGRHDGLAAAATPLGLVRLANDIAYRR